MSAMTGISGTTAEARPREQSERRDRSRLGSSVVALLAGAALIFEQSPANEALRTNVGLEAFQATGRPVVVGLVVAAITAVIEIIPAALISFGLHLESGAVRRLKEKMIRRRPEIREEAPAATVARRVGRGATDVAVALGLGAGLVAVRRHVTDPDPTLRKDLIASGWAAAVISVVSGMIGYLVAGGLSNAERVGLGRVAGWIVDYGANTWFWVGVLVVGYIGYKLVDLVRGLLGRRAPATQG